MTPPVSTSGGGYEALRSAVRRGELLTAAMVDRGDPAPPRARRKRAAGRPPRGPVGGVPDAARRVEQRAKVAASRAAQGLPPFITDEATLSKIADLLIVARYGKDAGIRARRTPRSLGAARPGWDAPWWDTQAGRPAQPREISTWRREGRRRHMREHESTEQGMPTGGLAGQASGPVLRRAWLRVQHGRPGWLAARVAAAGVPLVAQLAAPGDPAVPALVVGALTWLVQTARLDLAPRGRR